MIEAKYLRLFEVIGTLQTIPLFVIFYLGYDIFLTKEFNTKENSMLCVMQYFFMSL